MNKACARPNCSIEFDPENVAQMYCSSRCKNNEEQRRTRVRIRSKIFDLLGNKCKNCGFHDAKALQIDHILGGGIKEYTSARGTISGSVQTYRNILKNLLSGEVQYQLLCANCNWIKRHDSFE